MFTGIIEELGKIQGLRGLAGERIFTIAAPGISPLKPGESVAVNGVCLTVTESTPAGFTVQVSPQSLDRSTLGKLRVGEKVNLERALRPTDRIGGHLVSGHVDGVGKIRRIEPEGNSRRVWISCPEEVAPYLVLRGSVAVEGISLTIAELKTEEFAVAVIPFTWDNTSLKEKSPGSPVNLEADQIGKYIQKFVSGRPGAVPKALFNDD
ncbi:MAG: riboflavin synthase [bacterium]|nr:riboflavin synthase [bacterium]